VTKSCASRSFARIAALMRTVFSAGQVSTIIKRRLSVFFVAQPNQYLVFNIDHFHIKFNIIIEADWAQPNLNSI